jgi:hypothetical protein
MRHLLLVCVLALPACKGMGGFAAGLGHLAGGLGHVAAGAGRAAGELGHLAAPIAETVVRATPVVVRVAADVVIQTGVDTTDAMIEALTWGAITHVDEPYEDDDDDVVYRPARVPSCDDAMKALARADAPTDMTESLGYCR